MQRTDTETWIRELCSMAYVFLNRALSYTYVVRINKMHNVFINIILSSACFEQHILTSIRLLIWMQE